MNMVLVPLAFVESDNNSPRPENQPSQAQQPLPGARPLLPSRERPR
jgi:hypothetical protein